MNYKKQELTPSQSIKMMKELLNTKVKLDGKSFKPGNLLIYYYNAKDKLQTYDRTPLVLILKRNSKHTLAINFHWAPIPLRLALIKKILRLNAKNIKNKKPLEFSYSKLKPFLKKIGFAPIIRLYINKRISTKGVIIPPEQLITVAKMKTETFTRGKYSAETLYKKAISAAKNSKGKR